MNEANSGELYRLLDMLFIAVDKDNDNLTEAGKESIRNSISEIQEYLRA